ncbi:hypothetical protein EYC84_001669 [Monilinia fructicola]|uniref:Uncharacterized protein n=1 Tax=Monilinia fructicola TaxID=38448 RepID=A0A5M9JY73_MONFR|nr:hypothetical protein EYC84_001669 [Monilinia fructicola]
MSIRQIKTRHKIHYYSLPLHFSLGNNIQMYNFGFSLLKSLMFPSPRPNTIMDISEYHQSNRCTGRATLTAMDMQSTRP